MTRTLPFTLLLCGGIALIIAADLTEAGQPSRWEQLWARQVDADELEICCIPFFTYGVMLGDIVRTGTYKGKDYVVRKVVKPSGHHSFRVWFGNSSSETVRDYVLCHADTCGAETEWSSPNLLAIDVADEADAQRLADFLAERASKRELEYETGR